MTRATTDKTGIGCFGSPRLLRRSLGKKVLIRWRARLWPPLKEGRSRLSPSLSHRRHSSGGKPPEIGPHHKVCKTGVALSGAARAHKGEGCPRCSPVSYLVAVRSPNFVELRQCEVRRFPLPRTLVNKQGQRVPGCFIAVCSTSRLVRLQTFLLAPGHRRKPLPAIDAGIAYASETKLASPFDQVRLEPGLEVLQDLLYRVPSTSLFVVGFYSLPSIGYPPSYSRRRRLPSVGTEVDPFSLRCRRFSRGLHRTSADLEG